MILCTVHTTSQLFHMINAYTYARGGAASRNLPSVVLQMIFIWIEIIHCTCEAVYQTKYVQSKRLLNFGKYGYGGHADIKCKSFNVPLIRLICNMSPIPIFTKIKQPFALHIFCLVNGFASTVYYICICKILTLSKYVANQFIRQQMKRLIVQCSI